MCPPPSLRANFRFDGCVGGGGLPSHTAIKSVPYRTGPFPACDLYDLPIRERVGGGWRHRAAALLLVVAPGLEVVLVVLLQRLVERRQPPGRPRRRDKPPSPRNLWWKSVVTPPSAREGGRRRGYKRWAWACSSSSWECLETYFGI